jgi:low temperature requirement protein LtrA
MVHNFLHARTHQHVRRGHHDGDGQVTSIELFFDLVFVFAVTQLSHLLFEHLSVHGALQALLLLLPVWTAWIYTAWATNWLNPNHIAVRIMLISVMFGSLIMSAVLPDAFGERGLTFAVAYVAIQVGRSSFVAVALRDVPGFYQNLQRIVSWSIASGVFWIAGGLAEGSSREALWLAAAIVDFLAPIVYFYTPGLGRSTLQDWTIDGQHIAERCRLFMIVALGESILVIGATFGEMRYSAWVVAALVAAFTGSVALWWVYFDRTADLGSEVIAASADPGRLGRSAYTYFHIPMVAGIIVTAVGDELTIAHPTGETDMATAITVLGGPALFLAGHALFKWSLVGRVSSSRVTAIAVLAALIPIAPIMSPVILSSAATLVVVGVVWADARHLRRVLSENQASVPLEEIPVGDAFAISTSQEQL